MNQRARRKAYGILLTCLACRAVHVELAPNYSVEGFLFVLRKYVSLRGYPSKLYSDPGTQLTAADKELRMKVKDFDWKSLKDFGSKNGLEWHFITADHLGRTVEQKLW